MPDTPETSDDLPADGSFDDALDDVVPDGLGEAEWEGNTPATTASGDSWSADADGPGGNPYPAELSGSSRRKRLLALAAFLVVAGLATFWIARQGGRGLGNTFETADRKQRTQQLEKVYVPVDMGQFTIRQTACEVTAKGALRAAGTIAAKPGASGAVGTSGASGVSGPTVAATVPAVYEITVRFDTSFAGRQQDPVAEVDRVDLRTASPEEWEVVVPATTGLKPDELADMKVSECAVISVDRRVADKQTQL